MKFLSVLVAALSPLAVAVAADASGNPATARSAAGFTQSFRSAPGLHPPAVTVSGRDPDPGYGEIITDAHNSIQPGPIILSPQGQLIWFSPVPARRFASDVKVQRYEGQPVVTYWQGYGGALPKGEDVIVNRHYQTVATVHAGNGYVTDPHEFTILANGRALLTAYKVIPANLSSLGGPRHGRLIASAIQEIDIATGRVLWQWRADRHVPLSASYVHPHAGYPWDAFHLNSIQQLPGGKLLVSIRHTWAVYKISQRTGAILWTLGGKRSSFSFGAGARFEWQHDARIQRNGTLTLFDNGAGPGTQHETQSRALRLRLHVRTHRATLVNAYVNRPMLLSSSQGAVQPLPDGNVFVGWGTVPKFAEFSAGGRELFSMYLHGPVECYRAFRLRWTGQPTAPPGIAVRADHRDTTVFASWNGATGVASWRVLAGATPTALKPVKRFSKTNFETETTVHSSGAYLAVQALGRRGHVLGSSAAVKR